MLAQTKVAMKRLSNRAFTLIELLVVIGCVLVLLALLLPLVGTIRELALRTSCASQVRQIGLSLMSYANDYEGQLPRATADWNEPYMTRHMYLNNPSLTGMIVPYCDNMRIFTCTSYRMSTTIDQEEDDAGTGLHCGWMTYCYFPGRAFPAFVPGEPVPIRISQLGSWVILQDNLFDWSQFSNCSWNHPRLGNLYAGTATHDPGFSFYSNSVFSASCGANLLWGDGHVEWHKISSLKLFSPFINNWYVAGVYSLAPGAL